MPDEDVVEAGSGSGDVHPPPELALPITMLTLGAAMVAGLSFVAFYFSRRPSHLRQDPTAGSVALLDAQQQQHQHQHQQHQPSLDTPPRVESFFAFDTPQFSPPLLAQRLPAPTSDTAMQACRSSHASASEAVVEAIPEPEGVPALEDDGSGIPSALVIDMPEAKAIDGRHVVYSLRDLPCVVAEEIQEI